MVIGNPLEGTLWEDRRARVPFALVGVLLLVTGAAYAAGVSDQGLVAEDRSVETTMERTDADATAALTRAAREASHAAAAEPVTSAAGAETDAIRNESAFTDAYRIRLALAGAAALEAVETNRSGVTATVSTPTPESPNDLETARDRVVVEPVANGTATRVTFRNVTTQATRDGRVVATTTRNRTVVAAVPTLAAHERTEAYESRLNRGPLEGAGLGRQLTASLYPMTWARGYAQYAGAPVQNVLANRHVELSTNAGMVRTQRDVFGAADPEASGGVSRATARTGVADLLAPTAVDEEAWSEAVLDAPTPEENAEPDEPVAPVSDGSVEAGNESNETTTVSPEAAADEGLVAVHEGIDELVRDAYRVEASLSVSTTRLTPAATPNPSPPADASGNPTDSGAADTNATWEAVERAEDTEVAISGDTGETPSESLDTPISPDEPLDFGATTREVTVDRTVTVRWERTTVDGVERETTTATDRERHRVEIAVTGTYAPTADAPARTIAAVGGLAGTPAAARDELRVADAADVDGLARTAAKNGGNGGDVATLEESTVVYGDPPSSIHDAVADDLDDRHAAVHGMETDVEMERVAAGEADPYGELAAALRADHDALAGAPSAQEAYDDPAHRATVAARTAYLTSVRDSLDEASSADAATTDGLEEQVADESGDAGQSASEDGAGLLPAGDSLGDVLASREAAREPSPHAVGADGPGGSVTLRPDGAPGYLPRTAVDRADVEGVSGTTTRPLVTRNLNYVTVPYGDVADGIVERLLGDEDAVRLHVAGRALADADRALAAEHAGDSENPEEAETAETLRADRDRLADRIDRSLRVVDDVAAGTLRDHTSLSPAESQAVVERSAAEHDGRANRTRAVANGEYAERIAAHAAHDGELSTREESRLAAELRVELRDATGRDAVTVPARFVDGPTERSRSLIRRGLEDATEDGVERVGDEVGEEAAERGLPTPIQSVGAGLPVAPVPGYWVATVNAWRVEVRGEYPRFAVRADVGPPGNGSAVGSSGADEAGNADVTTDADATSDPDGGFAYVRESGEPSVALASNETVRLGTTEPVRFETGTLVAVAVPAGPPGVGDVDGTRDETSGAWPCPETAAAEPVDGDCPASG